MELCMDLQEQGKVSVVDARTVPDKKGRLVRRQPPAGTSSCTAGHAVLVLVFTIRNIRDRDWRPAGAGAFISPPRRKRLARRQQPAAARIVTILADDALAGSPLLANGSVAAATSMAKPAPSTASESAKSVPAATRGVEATSPATEKLAQPRKRCDRLPNNSIQR